MHNVINHRPPHTDTKRDDMESLLSSIASALHEALADVHEAQGLVQHGPRRYVAEADAEHAVQHLLQAIEDNLMDTVTGLRLVERRARRDEAADERPPPAP